MLAELQQHRFVEGRNQALARIDEPALTEGQVSAHELVERGLLSRVFAVAQPALLGLAVDVDAPGSFAEREALIPQGDGHLGWEVIGDDRFVGLL